MSDNRIKALPIEEHDQDQDDFLDEYDQEDLPQINLPRGIKHKKRKLPNFYRKEAPNPELERLSKTLSIIDRVMLPPSEVNKLIVDVRSAILKAQITAKNPKLQKPKNPKKSRRKMTRFHPLTATPNNQKRTNRRKH